MPVFSGSMKLADAAMPFVGGCAAARPRCGLDTARRMRRSAASAPERRSSGVPILRLRAGPGGGGGQTGRKGDSLQARCIGQPVGCHRPLLEASAGAAVGVHTHDSSHLLQLQIQSLDDSCWARRRIRGTEGEKLWPDQLPRIPQPEFREEPRTRKPAGPLEREAFQLYRPGPDPGRPARVLRAPRYSEPGRRADRRILVPSELVSAG